MEARKGENRYEENVKQTDATFLFESIQIFLL